MKIIAPSHVRTTLFALMIAAGVMPGAANSQDELTGTRADRSLDALAQCARIPDDAERLACFDREAAQLITAVDTGEMRIVEKGEVEETRKRLFGYALPRTRIFDGDDGRELDLLETTITSVRQVAPGEWHFRVAEGNALWRVKNDSVRMKTPKAGEKVVFKKAAVGTYFIRINGRTGVRGNRIG